MRFVAAIAPVLGLALVLAGCGGGDEQAAEATTAGVAPLTVALHAENDSGRSGEARLEQVGDDEMRVTVKMDRGPTRTNMAHIHNVTCAEYRAMDSFSDQLGTIEDTLRALRDGASETKVGAPLAERATGGYAINVHEPTDPYMVIACGDIPKR